MSESLFHYMEAQTLVLPKENPFARKLEAQSLKLSEEDLAGHRHYVEAAHAAVEALERVLRAGDGTHFGSEETHAIEAISRRIRAVAIHPGLIEELPRKPVKRLPRT